MVKKGTKRKPTIERIAKRESAATTFTKRTYGLHSKIAQLCLLTDAQIAVLATPPSANSNVSFFSFGHSSVDSIVNAFLTGERPVREERDDKEDLGICFARKELGLPQWWEDNALLKSKNLQELNRAVNSMSRLLSKIKELRADDAADEQEQPPPPLKKMKKTEPTVEQTLGLHKTLDCNNNVMTEEEELDHIMSTCESFCLPRNNNKMTEPVDQPLIFPSDICVPDSNDFSTEEMSLAYEIEDINQLIDFDLDTTSLFLDDWLLESGDGFVETTTTTTQESNSYYVACDYDASALNEDTDFSDYLTQFLQS
ncbi:MADS-box transcription factor family protein [Raphanus sativus]|uniref:Agamous-like MADS-box protein AGL97 n=1 Tax=Raphanus sativus TaxID=3726 RepID=A0A6J0NK43_RAPSA|nr:agamous-like MADS-box protein AGL97 [Raphanus sativus]KAJ4904528.1 MADS-box transcription factor family protein [Raphanus sativus]